MAGILLSGAFGFLGEAGGAANTILRRGNYMIMAFFWAMVGTACILCAPLFLLNANEYWTVALGITVGGSYFIGMLLRMIGITRQRPIWWVGMLIDCVVAGITTSVAVLHDNTPQSVVGLMLIALSMFAMVEIAKPRFDYGIVQFFVRLPLQTAILGGCSFGYIISAGAVLVGCTVWQAFFIQYFLLPAAVVGAGTEGEGVGPGPRGSMVRWRDERLIVWAVLGIICGIFCPCFFVKKDFGLWMLRGGFIWCTLYVIGFKLRPTVLMKKRGPWYVGVVVNSFMEVVTIAINMTVSQLDGLRGCMGLILIGILVWVWVEVARPVFDYRLVHFFVRLPFQKALKLRFHRLSLPFILGTGVLVIFCAAWEAYFTPAGTPIVNLWNDMVLFEELFLHSGSISRSFPHPRVE